MQELKPLLRVPDVAGILGISENQVHRMLKRGELKATKLGAGWRITQDDLIAYLKSKGFSFEPKDVKAPIAAGTPSQHSKTEA
jgi:excisionase family DNA binding protein